MKVFNLACDQEHRFEGWFASADAYDTQLAADMVECPLCGSKAIHRLPAAPRLNLTSHAAPDKAEAKPPARGDEHAAQVAWLKMARKIVENTEDVGENFSDEARRIHYDEAPARSIRGVASPKQAAELADEGIEVFAFPFPKAAKESLQ